MNSYYAVIFTSKLSGQSDGYDEMAIRMEQLAEQQPGYLGLDSARSEIGITISYWKDLDAIKNWKSNLDHLKAQRLGKEKWYRSYKVMVCRIDKEYSFKNDDINLH
jgi:heme-degrading monooxygenase HmoA